MPAQTTMKAQMIWLLTQVAIIMERLNELEKKLVQE